MIRYNVLRPFLPVSARASALAAGARAAAGRQRFGFLAAVGCAALLAAALLAGCAGSTVGTSQNDKYEVFSDDAKATFVPRPLDEAAARGGDDVVLVDEGWWAKDSYIHYGIKVRNPNSDLIARDVTVQVTSYDEEGVQLSEEQALISFIGPDTTIGFAGTCGSGQKPAEVVIELLGTTAWQDADGYEEPLLIASVEEQDKGYYRYEFTGGVTNNTGAYVSTAPVCILLEDGDGRILAGYEGSAKRIKEGRTSPYQITINTAPDHAQVEVFAHWSSLNDDTNQTLAGEG